MDTTKNRLQAVKSRIAAACRACGRDARDIVLVAVSKGHDADAIRAAFEAGQHDFGESYVQEAIDKIDALADLPIRWHYIGPVQSNKTRVIATHFDWVHSIDRLRIAERLSAQRPPTREAMNVCVQVNVSGEASKQGVAPEAVPELLAAVTQLPGLRLRGLMTIPEATEDAALTRQRFDHLSALLQAARANGLSLDTLSMGMSGDFETAIAAGATHIRVGTAIFGERPLKEAS